MNPTGNFRNRDQIRNVLLDEALTAILILQGDTDPLVYAEQFGRLYLIHRIARRLKINMPKRFP